MRKVLIIIFFLNSIAGICQLSPRQIFSIPSPTTQFVVNQVSGTSYFDASTNAMYTLTSAAPGGATLNTTAGKIEWSKVGHTHDLSNYVTLDGAQTITGNKLFEDGSLILNGTRITTLKSSATGSNKIITFPNATGTVIVGLTNTTGSIPYYTTNGVIADSPIWTDGNYIGIGTTTSTNKLGIVHEESINRAAIQISSYYTNNAVPQGQTVNIIARGTIASPTAIQLNDIMGGFRARGYGATGFSLARVGINGYAAENWTDAAQGTYISFMATNIGTTTMTETMRIGNGKVGIGTTSPDSTLTVNGAIKATNLKLTGKAEIPEIVGVIEQKYSLLIDSTFINETAKYPIGYSQGFVIDSIIIVATSTTGVNQRLGTRFYFGSDMSATGTTVNTSSNLSVENFINKVARYGGSTLTNTSVTKGNILWLKIILDAPKKPRMIHYTIIGHKS